MNGGQLDGKPGAGYVKLKAFDMNTVQGRKGGEPEMQPADCLLITISDGGRETYLLVDAGKRGQARLTVIPYLQAQGITHLDHVLLTHQHDDHFGGLIDLLEEESISIGQFYYAPLTDEQVKRGNHDANYNNWLLFKQVLGQQAARIGTIRDLSGARPGERLALAGDCFMDIVAVPDIELLEQGAFININNASIVVRLNYKAFSALLAADCGAAQAEAIWNSPQRQLIEQVTLLKASHHGGGESMNDACNDAADARIVIVTCNELVVEGVPQFVPNYHRFSRRGAKVYRMDWLHGLDLITDGEELHGAARAHQYEETIHLRLT